MYKVYVKTDETGRVISVNSDAFLPDTSGWALIDEGEGDHYHHAQGNYLYKPIITEEGIYRYKMVDGEIVERTPIEIQTEIDALLPPQKTTEEAVVELLENSEIEGKATRILFRTLAKTGAIEDNDILENPTIFLHWHEHIGTFAEEGTIWRYGDNLFRVNEGMGHTLQSDWLPTISITQFSRVGTNEDEILVWVQGSYNAGTKVSNRGKMWQSVIDNNVWEPGSPGIDERYWVEVPQ